MCCLSRVRWHTDPTINCNDLAPGGPAERAASEYDVIVAMDGEVVVDGRAAMFQIAQLRPGHLLRVRLDRMESRSNLKP